MEVQQTDKGSIYYNSSVAYMPGVQAAVTFSENLFYQDKDIKPKELPSKSKKELKYVPWGEENTYPMEVIAMIEKNPVASPLLEFKIDLSYGSGVKLGRMVDDEFVAYNKKELKSLPGVREANEFFKDNNFNSQLSEIFTDIHWFQQSNIELILNRDKNKIAEINAKETAFSRWSEMDEKGRIPYHLYSAKWGEQMEEKDYIITKVLDFKKPQLDLKRRMGLRVWPDAKTKADNNTRYIFPIRFATPGRRYYPSPYWHSVIKSGWLEYHNMIPEFKKAMMTNSINVKYHVEISQEYLPRIFAEEGILGDKEKMEARKQAEYKGIQDFLTGQKNTGKPIISYFKTTPDGKVEIKDIRITVIENKVGGEYNEDSQEGSAMIYTSFRVHPNLIGVIPSKNSSNLSGSDKRELLRIAQTFQKRTRDKVLEVLELIKEINGWPEELEFSITDIILTSLDQGKEVQEINTQS